MSSRAISILILLAITAGSAHAACPGVVPGSTVEGIEANKARLACLQRELSDSATTRHQQQQIDALIRNFDAFTIQRKFDNLPVFRSQTFD